MSRVSYVKIKSMKILLTGASGFIGKHLYPLLSEHDVYPLVRHPCGLKNEIICDLESLNTRYLPYVDVVIHLAAKVDFDSSLNDLINVNVIATDKLAEYAKSNNAQFIYTSTIMVHGKDADHMERDTEINPDTPYAYSKWLGEKLIRATNIHYCILRLAGVYGLGGCLGLNKTIEDALSGIYPRLDKDGLRNYIYVKDVAKIIRKMIDLKFKGTYLIAGRELLLISDMLRMINEVFEFDNDIEVKNRGRDQIVNPVFQSLDNYEFREAIKEIKNV